MAVATDPAPFAERGGEGGTERPTDILDGVMAVDLQVARARDLEVEETMAREEHEHVVEESEAGGDLGPTRAVEIERNAHVRFPGRAADGGGAWHGGCLGGTEGG